MTRRNTRAKLEKWFLDVDELLAAQKEYSISPWTVPSARTEPATWTTTLAELRRDLVGLVDLFVSSPDVGSSSSTLAVQVDATCSC